MALVSHNMEINPHAKMKKTKDISSHATIQKRMLHEYATTITRGEWPDMMIIAWWKRKPCEHNDDDDKGGALLNISINDEAEQVGAR